MDNTEKKKLCYSVKMSDINVTRVPEKKKKEIQHKAREI